MGIQSTDDVRITKNNGFVAISLSKVVEVSSNSLCMICINGPDYEFEALTSIFSPVPQDEVLAELISDIIHDTSTGAENLFTMATEIQGEFSMKVRREDFDIWKESYYQELADLIAENTPDKTEDGDLIVEVVIMQNVHDLVFVLIANSAISTAMLDEESDEEDSLDPDVEAELDDDDELDPED